MTKAVKKHTSTSATDTAATKQQREEIRERVGKLGLNLHCAAEICDRLELTGPDSDVIGGIQSLFEHAYAQVVALEAVMVKSGVIKEGVL